MNPGTPPAPAQEPCRPRQAETLAAILAASSDLIFLCDRSGRFLEVGPATARAWKREPQELVGGTWTDLDLDPKTCRHLTLRTESVIQGGHSAVDEIALRLAQGTRYCECLIAPVPGEDGTIQAAVVTLRDVTRRRMIEESLHRSEERFRLLAENSTDMISRHDPAGVYLYASPACRRLLGYDPEELAGHSAYEFIHPDDLGVVARSHEGVLRSDETTTITFRIRSKDGAYRWFETTSRTIRDPGTGAVAEIQCASRDATSRVAAERELRDSRALLQAILDHATAVIYIKDLKFRFLYVNRRYGEIFGVAPETFAGRTDHDLFPPEAADAFRANDRRVLETGEPIEVEEVVPRNGQRQTFLSIKFPIRHRDGAVFAVGGISTDITGIKRSQSEVQRKTQILKMVLDGMAEAVLVADEDRRIALINPAAERLFQLELTDVGRSLDFRPNRLFYPDMTTPIEDRDRPLERSLRGEEVNDVEVFVRGVDPAASSWGIVSGRPLRDADGRPKGAVIVYRDVTERKQVAEQLREAEAHLIQAEKLSSLGQMVAGVAHEINNPLAYVGNNLAVLRRDLGQVLALLAMYREADPVLAAQRPELAAALAGHTELHDLEYGIANLDGLIVRSTEGLRRIQQIVKDLRAFARVDEADFRTADLNEGIRSTVNIIQARARVQDVAIELDLGELPPIVCQASRVNQVVMNLVANAIDASPKGGTIVVRTRAEPCAISIKVIDGGHGVPADLRDKIFDPFFTTKPVGRGTGLGLSISYGIVRDHGGTIEVTSEPGRGAEFEIRLPLVSAGSPGPSPSR